LGLKEDDFLAGLLTPLEDLKILREQLEALKILNDQAPRLKVIVFGQGNLHLEQLRHEQPLDISNLYFYLGFEERKADVLASLDFAGFWLFFFTSGLFAGGYGFESARGWRHDGA